MDRQNKLTAYTIPTHRPTNLSGRFWAIVIASSKERLLDLRSCWIVFIRVVRGRPGGLHFSEKEAVTGSYSWHLSRLAFLQCDRTEKDAVLGK